MLAFQRSCPSREAFLHRSFLSIYVFFHLSVLFVTTRLFCCRVHHDHCPTIHEAVPEHPEVPWAQGPGSPSTEAPCSPSTVADNALDKVASSSLQTTISNMVLSVHRAGQLALPYALSPLGMGGWARCVDCLHLAVRPLMLDTLCARSQAPAGFVPRSRRQCLGRAWAKPLQHHDLSLC